MSYRFIGSISTRLYDLQITWLRDYDEKAFLSGIDAFLSASVSLLKNITGKEINLIDVFNYDTIYNTIASWRTENNYSLDDIPDWLIDVLASRIAIESVKRNIENLGGVLIPYTNNGLSALSSPRLTIYPKLNSKVLSDEVFEVILVRDDGSSETRSLNKDLLYSIRFSNSIYDLAIKTTSKNASWIASVTETYPPQAKANLLTVLHNANVFNKYTPIHFTIDPAYEIDLSLEVDQDQIIKITFNDPRNYSINYTEHEIKIYKGLTDFRFIMKTYSQYQISIITHSKAKVVVLPK